jgi:leucyl-tRNA synthetase
MAESGIKPKRSYEKMSKSKYNGVDPAECIAKHGADCTRAHILFSAPASEVLEWDEGSIIGMERWLGKVWRVVLTAALKKTTQKKEKQKTAEMDMRSVSRMSDAEILQWRYVQQTVLDVTEALEESYSLNTMVSNLIKLTNSLAEQRFPMGADIQLLCAETLVKLIAPVAPAVAEECWGVVLKAKGETRAWRSVFDSAWPEVEDKSIFDVVDVKCAVQLDGKTRFVLDIPGTLIEKKEEIVKLVLKAPKGEKWVGGMMKDGKPLDIIVAPGGRVINFVFKKKTLKI